MQEEAELIVKAIESLKTEGNVFKDYVFPLVIGFFSALLGGGVAYYTLRHHENIQFERLKIDTANEFTIVLDEALQTLISIKSNYHKKLDAHPFQRVSRVPSIIFRSKYIELDISKLSFLVPKLNDAQSVEKWRSITRIRTMIQNYNYLLDLWEKRNSADRPIKEKLVKNHSNYGYAEITTEEIFECVGAADFTVLVDLTEHTVRLTDDILIEVHDFLTNFPTVCKSAINTKAIEGYGSVMSCRYEDNTAVNNLLLREPEVCYEELAELFNEPVDQVIKRYETGYY